MDKIVLDTSTLILQAKTDLLRPLADHASVVIPRAVEFEASRKPDLTDAKLIRQLIREEKIKVVEEKNRRFIHVLEEDFKLGKGEAEAISLAKSQQAFIGIDDGLAIKVCRVVEVRFLTSLTLLTYFYRKGLLSQKQTFAKLDRLGVYGWYSGVLLSKVRNEIEKGGNS